MAVVGVAVPKGLTELDDRWLLPFRGLAVTRVVVDFQFGLVLDAGCTVSIGGLGTLSWTSEGRTPGTAELRPASQEVAAGLTLFGARVMSAVAFKSGVLRLAFSSGCLLRVTPDPVFEAWTATAPDGLLVVCMPGGPLAVWQPLS